MMGNRAETNLCQLVSVNLTPSTIFPNLISFEREKPAKFISTNKEINLK